MKCVFLLLFSGFLVHSQALECGLKNGTNEDLREALNSCVKDNQTLQSIMEMAMSSGSTTPSQNSEEIPVVKGVSSTTQKPNSKRMRRASRNLKKIQSDSNQKGKKEEPMPSTTEMVSTTENMPENSPENSPETSTVEDVSEGTSSEVCLIQCIFNKMDMTDSEGFPEQDKLLESLTKNAGSNKQLKDFLKQSAEECFQQSESEHADDNCAYTTKLVTCLAEKGRSNCQDWPTGNLPF